MSTTAICLVLLQNCVDLVQLEGVSYIKEEENPEPTTSGLIDPLVGFMSVECLACFIGI